MCNVRVLMPDKPYKKGRKNGEFFLIFEGELGISPHKGLNLILKRSNGPSFAFKVRQVTCQPKADANALIYVFLEYRKDVTTRDILGDADATANARKKFLSEWYE